MREILIVPHTHHDIGYTDTPRNAEALHRESIKRGLQLISTQTEHAAQMTWTIEVSRPLIELLRTESDLIPAVVEAQKAGRLCVTGGYLHMTQLVGNGGYDRLFAGLNELRSYGISVSTVQHGDVNGIGWGVVPAMQRANLSTLVMALNPDHGRAPFEQPSIFWWEGPNHGRILVALNCHYGLANQWGMLTGNAPDQTVVDAFLNRLDERDDYPFDCAVVHAAHDNRAPSDAILTAVDAWNAIPGAVPMRMATTDDAVRAYRAGPIDRLPTVRGEWADWWAHGHGSSALEVALGRESERNGRGARTIIAGTLLAETAAASPVPSDEWYGEPYAAKQISELVRLDRDLTESLGLWWEHTWGASESITSPQSDFTRTHWHAKAGFVHTAFQNSHSLVAQAFGRIADPVGDGSDVHRIPNQILAVNTSDARQETVVTVPINTGSVEAFVQLEPFEVSAVETINEGDLRIFEIDGAADFETDYYAFTIDPEAGGITRLIQRSTGRSLIDGDAEFPFAAVVDETVEATSDHPMLANRKKFHPDFPGPDFTRTVARADTGTRVVRQRIGRSWTDFSWTVSIPDVLTASVRCLVVREDIRVTVRLEKVDRYEPESLFVTFPFAAEDPQFLLETTDAVYLPESEQLPGTCRDWYSIQSAVGVANGDGSGILWGTLDAPLVALSGFHTGQWAEHLHITDGHINSWVMNNLYFTNFKASQSGVVEFRYVFRPVERVDKLAVKRFGNALSHPLLARGLADVPRVSHLPHISVTPADFDVKNIAALDDDTVSITVVSNHTERATATLSWNGNPIQFSADQHSWRDLPPVGLELNLDPGEEQIFYLRRNSQPM